jgi:hypothetical protein
VRGIGSSIVVLLLASACTRYAADQPLQLTWTTSEVLRPSGAVGTALSATSFGLSLHDERENPAVIGGYSTDGARGEIQTRDNVAQYCGQHLSELLGRAGARISKEPAPMMLQTALLEYQVHESEKFNGLIRMRVSLVAEGNVVWWRTYAGTAESWGRTHNPQNFNEALSGALASIASQLINDDSFAAALRGDPQAPPPEPPAGPGGAG